MPRWLFALSRSFRLLLRLLCKFDVQGEEYATLQPPYILVANHLSWLDVVLMFALLHHKTAVFAAEKWQRHPLVRPLFRGLGHAIFVQRGGIDRQALRAALAWLKRGGALGIAPEGTRSPVHALQAGKEGTAYLARRAAVPILPVVGWGQEKALAAWLRGHRPAIHVRFGAPFRLPAQEKGRRAAQWRADTEMIMLRLAVLLPPEYQGVYRDKVAALHDATIAPRPGK